MLLHAREIFAKSESRYLLNELWMNDYCVWLQCDVTNDALQTFSIRYKNERLNITKESFDTTFKLNMIEKCFSDMKIVAQAKEEEEQEEESSSSEEEEESSEDEKDEKEPKEKPKKILIEEL
jgi:hypothetical protein